MVKILHCITDLSPDGAQRTLLRLVTKLPSSEFDHSVVTLAGGGHLVDRFKEAGITVISLGMKRGIPGISALLKLRSVISEVKPDVIQGWMYHGNLAASLGALLAGTPARVVWNIRRGLYDKREDKILTRGVIKAGALVSSHPQKIIYCVRVAADQHEAVGFDASKRIVIPNGFDTTRFAPRPGARTSLRAMLGLENEAPLVAIAGRYHPQKDFPSFLRAFKAVNQRIPAAHAVLVGRGVDQSCEELVGLLRELEIGSVVHLLGERQDLPDILAGSDIFCSSSINEGFSNVVSEAMSSALPCVATDAGASREIVEGVGIVVERRDIASLAGGMVEMLEKTPEERLRIGEASRDRIVRLYSLPSMLRQYEELYRSLGLEVEPKSLKAAA